MASGNWKAVCSQFIRIGTDGTTMALKDLVPGGGWKSGDSIKIVNKNCVVEKECCYISQAEIDALPPFLKPSYPTTAGWFLKGSWKEADRLDNEPLPFGSAVLAMSAADSYLTSNGEVLESETGMITFELTSGNWKYVGNCTPVALTLKDFVPGGGWKSGDSIKLVNKNCVVEKECCYISQAEIDALPPFLKPSYPTTAGWFLKGSWKEADRLDSTPIPAGDGFIAMSAADSTITLPSAL